MVPAPLVVDMEGSDPTPAIVRDVCDADRPTRIPLQNGVKRDASAVDKIISQPKDAVSSSPGWGDSGHRIQTVEHDCPACNFDRMIRRIDVSPELPTEVRYWCLNPNCVHYVSDYLSHACHGSYPQRRTDEPAVFEESDA